MLYLRMFVNMALGFYTSRIVLEALGVNDYGIFNLVGGVIVLANMLNTSFTASTSRFITYSLGLNDLDKCREAFTASFRIHVFLTVFFLIIAETVGLWFVNTQLNIAPDRMVAANWVYQAAVISTGLSITQAPFTALLTSHERFDIFAYAEIASSVLKLGIAFLILSISSDRLIFYSICYAILSIGIMTFYRQYCHKNFNRIVKRIAVSRSLFKEMLSFSGWNMLYSGSNLVSTQSRAILLNWFFGTALNAAAGVASQVQGALYGLIGNFSKAFEPQITKCYAAKDYNRVNSLINLGTKVSAICTLIFTLPLVFKSGYLIRLWLVDVPEGAVVITQILLCCNFFNSFNPFVFYGLYATGRIRVSNILISAVNLALPVALYFILRLTHSYVIMFIASSASIFLTQAIYVVFLKQGMTSFAVRRYIFGTVIRLYLISAICTVVCIIFNKINIPEIASLIVIFAINIVIAVLFTYYIALSSKERHVILNFLYSFIKHR